MRTSYENWSRENWIGTAVLTALIGLPALTCGTALVVQARGLNSLRASILQTCNTEAAARANEALPGVGSAAPAESPAEPPGELPGLRPEFRASAPARAAFAICMDDKRSLNVFPVALNAGTVAPPQASARRTN